MNSLRWLIAIALVCVSVPVHGQEKNAKLILGTWVVTKSWNGKGAMPEGMVVEFAPGGKMKRTLEFFGKKQSEEVNYKVEGDKFTVTDMGMNKLTIKIKKLTEDELVTENESGKTVELKRKK
jgi:uncharacterized protein (TIGR03066 family)